MSQKIQAYFKTENDAENAVAQLQKLNASNVIVDELPEGGSSLILFPVANLGTTGSGMGNFGAPGFFGSKEEIKSMGSNKSETFTHIVEFNISEDESKEAFATLKEADAYIDSELNSSP
ncbi:hypothetical protein HXA31_11870 [Salipaludibacillus agaradhaerens]|jgi:hypothetical protein|uniref:Uncharacterized protein n=1 Tax=Salipaludibacillus agaradhaerens TaxID=76935 RepID=A0A9Q4AYY7_SALAG|nr:hypothetical protein [Salipaludibacillus agaradhaerens]MCR6095368.1 hypothetical protein [Salipaludibacillus agaradhaerens]MCR6115074.1 hypothetical protein [Salipaludibacillus agaradhaerens]